MLSVVDSEADDDDGLPGRSDGHADSGAEGSESDDGDGAAPSGTGSQQPDAWELQPSDDEAEEQPAQDANAKKKLGKTCGNSTQQSWTCAMCRAKNGKACPHTLMR